MKPKKPKLIKRTYRISTEDDKLVKKNKKRFGGESAFIRSAIREYFLRAEKSP
jgi:hypothetical protein